MERLQEQYANGAPSYEALPEYAPMGNYGRLQAHELRGPVGGLAVYSTVETETPGVADEEALRTVPLSVGAKAGSLAVTGVAYAAESAGNATGDFMVGFLEAVGAREISPAPAYAPPVRPITV